MYFRFFEKIPVSGETEALESLYLGKMERDKPDLLEAFFRLFLGYWRRCWSRRTKGCISGHFCFVPRVFFWNVFPSDLNQKKLLIFVLVSPFLGRLLRWAPWANVRSESHHSSLRLMALCFLWIILEFSSNKFINLSNSMTLFRTWIDINGHPLTKITRQITRWNKVQFRFGDRVSCCIMDQRVARCWCS